MNRIVKTGIRDSFFYSVPYVLVFNEFFFQRLTDSLQTTAMFFEITILMALLTSALFIIVRYYLRKWIKVTLSLYIVEFFVLFVASEISALIVAGVLPIFGIIYGTKLGSHFQNYVQGDADILLFRQQRDFALSASALISCFVFIVIVAAINGLTKAQRTKQ